MTFLIEIEIFINEINSFNIYISFKKKYQFNFDCQIIFFILIFE